MIRRHLGVLSACAVLFTTVAGCGDSTSADGEHVTNAAAALCSAATITTIPADTAPAGTVVQLSATGTCDSAGEYQFWAWSSSTSWVLVRDWAADPNATFDTTGAVPGGFTFAVNAREAGTNGTPEVAAEAGFSVTGSTCDAVTLTQLPSGGAKIGTTVDLTASASCGGANAEYQFSLYTYATDTWTLLRDWASSPEFAWDTTGFDPNSYTVSVVSRIAGHTEAEASSEHDYTLCGDMTVATSPDGAAGAGSQVTLTVDGTCGNGPTPEFIFYTYSSSAGWSVLQDWGASNSATWDTTNESPSDSHFYGVEVRFDGAYPYDGVEGTYTITSSVSCGSTTVSASPSSQTAGAQVQLTAGSDCIGGGTAEYRFYAYSSSTGWALVRDYATDPAATWDTTGLSASDSHWIHVDSRAVGSQSAAEGSIEEAYTLTP